MYGSGVIVPIYASVSGGVTLILIFAHVALGEQGIKSLAQSLELAAQDLDLLRRRIEYLVARRAIRHEFLLVGRCLDQSRLGRDADHHRSLGHVARDHRVRADARALANDDRAEHLRARTDDHAVE